jgi:hypothetical protein
MCLSFNGIAQNQEVDTLAFKYIELQISYNKFHSIDSEYDKYWEGGKSISFSITTSFYFGDVIGGIELTEFAGKGNKINFKSNYVYGGWGKSIKLHQKISVMPSIMIGSNMFDFSEDKLSTNPKEQEFSYGFQNTIKIRVLKKWGLNFTTSYRRILTAPTIKLFFNNVGISYRLNLGKEIRAFLI